MSAAVNVWATAVARQACAGCTVQAVFHHDGRTTFTVSLGESDTVEFTVGTAITVMELCGLIRSAADLLGAEQHRRAISSAPSVP